MDGKNWSSAKRRFLGSLLDKILCPGKWTSDPFPLLLALSPSLFVPTCVVTQKRACDEWLLSSSIPPCSSRGLPRHRRSIPPCSSRGLPRHRQSPGQWLKQSRLSLMSAEVLPPIPLLLSWSLSHHTQLSPQCELTVSSSISLCHPPKQEPLFGVGGCEGLKQLAATEQCSSLR